MKKTRVLYLLAVLLLAVSAAAITSSCSSDSSSSGLNTLESFNFSALAIPSTPEKQSTANVSSKATVKLMDGTTTEYATSYKVLYRSGDKDSSGNTAGLLYDINGKPILLPDGSQRVSNLQDAVSFLKRGGRYFHISHYEQSPGAIYLTEVAKLSDGTLTPISFRNIDLSSVMGTVINCAGSTTPWDTHMASEEDYYFDAYHFDPATAGHMAQHVMYCDKDANGSLNGDYTAPSWDPTADYGWWCKDMVKGLITDYLHDDANDPVYFTPYNYGYNFEIDVDQSGNASVKNGIKHFTFGKSSPEEALVMPDERTVYITDDGAFRGFYMFVADEKKNLDSGTLFMAKWNQTSDSGAGSANLTWIKLGSGTSQAIKAVIDKHPMFSDFFDVGDPANCPTSQGYKQISAGAPSEAMKNPMCLRLRDGSNGSTLSNVFKSLDEFMMAVAFLEARKYGTYLGATSEFNKEEGMAYNKHQNVLYVAMSRIETSMTKAYSGLEGGQDHIKLSKNSCGAVYEIALGVVEGTKSDYAGTTITSIVSGGSLKEGSANYDAYKDTYSCDPDKISEPDNLGYFHGKLFIGEDAGAHLNDMIWTWDTKDKKLTRIATCPAGGEWTGALAMYNAEGNFYVFANIQHPFGESNKTASGKSVGGSLDNVYSSSDLQKNIDKWGSSLGYKPTAADYRGYAGYIHGLPEMTE